MSSETAEKRFSLTGKNAVITGGGNGLGLEAAKALLEHGANTILLLDSNKASLDTAKAQLNTAFPAGNILINIVDVRKKESVQEALDYAIQNLSSIDILLPFAGIAALTLGLQDWTEKWQDILDVNLTGVYYTCLAFGDQMEKQQTGGSITMVASILGHISTDTVHPAYSCSKAGVLSLKSTLAEKYAKSNIRVNSISPAFIQTAMTSNNHVPSWYKEKLESLTMIPRFGFPNEVSGAIVFLASDAASYMTGTDIKIDGGFARTSSRLG